MKATLKFDLSDEDDKEKFNKALQGQSYSFFVFSYWNDVIRPLYKHDIPENLKNPDDLLEHMRQKFLDILADYNLSTD